MRKVRDPRLSRNPARRRATKNTIGNGESSRRVTLSRAQRLAGQIPKGVPARASPLFDPQRPCRRVAKFTGFGISASPTRQMKTMTESGKFLPRR